MKSHMMEVIIDVEIMVEYDVYHNKEFVPIIYNMELPYEVNKWIKQDVLRGFNTTDEEENMHYNRVERSVGFEVEVEYKEMADGSREATDAICHTICPNFVKAWIENEAMKQFNKEHESCMNSSVTSS